MSPFSSSPEQDKLRKQITDYTQYQWLALMPAWLPGVLNVVNHTKTAPGREGIVLLYHAGMLIFGIACFICVRVRLSGFKRRLAQLEADERARRMPPPPPIPSP